MNLPCSCAPVLRLVWRSVLGFLGVTDADLPRYVAALDRILQAIEPAKQLRLVILDASSHLPAANRDAPAEFAAAHIPGARLVAQDGENLPRAQNFKLLPWASVQRAIEPR